ncbi:MAG: flavodoxin family protein [Armatimonadetes bacterium]|nr:flavodoxin family protein [Armatimonadota bacterium]
MSTNALISVVYHSGYGHTAVVANKVQEGLASVEGVEARLFSVDDVDWDVLNASDAIVFGAPTYMGGPSAGFKAFADATAKPWFGDAWKDKLAAGFTNSGSNAGDKQVTLQYLATLAAQQGMLWIPLAVKSANGLNRNGYYLGLGTQSDNDSPEVTPGDADKTDAFNFGVRIAQATKRWKAGA